MASWRDGPDKKVHDYLENILRESQESSRKAATATRISLFLTTVAVISAFLSVYYARQSDIGSTVWQAEQLKYLSEIRQEMVDIKDHINTTKNISDDKSLKSDGANKRDATQLKH